MIWILIGIKFCSRDTGLVTTRAGCYQATPSILCLLHARLALPLLHRIVTQSEPVIRCNHLLLDLQPSQPGAKQASRLSKLPVAGILLQQQKVDWGTWLCPTLKRKTQTSHLKTLPCHSLCQEYLSSPSSRGWRSSRLLFAWHCSRRTESAPSPYNLFHNAENDV